MGGPLTYTHIFIDNCIIGFVHIFCQFILFPRIHPSTCVESRSFKLSESVPNSNSHSISSSTFWLRSSLVIVMRDANIILKFSGVSRLKCKILVFL